MRKNLIAALIFACLTSGCASMNTRDPSPGLGTALSRDPNQSKSCYGGPVYVPC